MQVEIERLDTKQRWSFQSSTIRMGRDPRCTLVLNDPEVSREHAQVMTGARGVWLQDLRSGQGTWLNNARVTEAELHDGDIVALGESGPQLRIGLAMGVAAGVTMQVPAAASKADFTPTLALGSTGAGGRAAAADSRLWEGVPSGAAAESETGADPEAWMALQAKLDRTQRMVKVSLAVLVLQLLLIAYLSSRIGDNARQLVRMQARAQNAVATLTPQLDQRITKLDAEMDGMDAKMKSEQDAFMARMKVELPQIMDAYLKKKMSELGTPGGR